MMKTSSMDPDEAADSARFERLKEVYNKVISAILLKGVTEDDAKACFADVLQTSKRFKEHHLTLVFQRLFMEQVPRNLKLEFQDVCDEFKIGASLQRLDQLFERRRTRAALAGGVASSSASASQPASSSSGYGDEMVNPERLVVEAICAKKRARLETLRNRLEAEQASLHALTSELDASHADEGRLRDKLDSLLVPFHAIPESSSSHRHQHQHQQEV